ncbi:hypothetical protein AB3Y40_12855 [Yoonia sp. R2331]|uniref:hypothetical protein n=1 Tax=Yoonia sp. R2331 TaxID=3237238 RepID=UPI0034E497FF
MSGDKVTEYVETISTLMAERLRIKGASLAVQIRKSGRRLPRRIKRDATQVAKANSLIQNPKLARMVDDKAIARAAENVIAHLSEIDPNEVLKDKVLWALGKVSAVLIALFIAAVWYARSRGLV